MRFVSPETVRIDLPSHEDGGKNWIEVKKHLSAGENHRFRSAGLTRLSQRDGGNEVSVDWVALAFARVEAYLVDWSAKNPQTGKDIPVSRAAIESLAPDDFDAIDKAVQQHIADMADPKKSQTSTAPTLTVV
jgi:hypothetical protein